MERFPHSRQSKDRSSLAKLASAFASSLASSATSRSPPLIFSTTSPMVSNLSAINTSYNLLMYYRFNRHVDDLAPSLAQQLLILLCIPYPLGIHIEHFAVLEGDGERLRHMTVMSDGSV